MRIIPLRLDRKTACHKRITLSVEVLDVECPDYSIGIAMQKQMQTENVRAPNHEDITLNGFRYVIKHA